MKKKNEKKASKYTPEFLKVAEEWITKNGLIQFGGATLKRYCSELGVHNVSHYNWLRDHPEYKEMIANSVEAYRQTHTIELFDSLMDAARGGYKENYVEDVDYKPNPNNPEKPMIAKKRTHKEKKYIPPNVAAAIFLITNLDPQNFVNSQKTDVNVHKEPPRELSMEEAQNLIKQLENGC